MLMTERMGDWNPPESWKRITCIMTIHSGHQNKENTVAAQCSVNTVITIRQELENCDGYFEAVARRKQHSRRSDCVRTAEFLENLQKSVLEDTNIGIMALSHELNVPATAMEFALNEDLHCFS